MKTSIYRLLTWVCLLLGLAGSGAVGYWMKLEIDAHQYQQFVSYCQEIKLRVATRLEIHEQTLLSGAATFDASQEVTRQEWHTYVKRLLPNEHFNGIQGLGFALWIPADQLAAHQTQIRAEGFPDYKVRPEGEREAYAPVTFIEPFTERNLRAFGYDMYSEPVRHKAMMRACDENIATLSEKVRLMQETDKNVQAGTLMYIPVYKKNKPIDTVEHRRDALFGWVYSPFRMTDLLNNIILENQDLVHLRVYDGRNTQAEQLLYDNNPNFISDDNNHHSVVEITNNFNGTVWTLQFEQLLEADSVYYINAWLMFGTGVLISLLLFLLSTSYLNTRVDAVKIAAKLTSKLQESEGRFRVLADSAPVLIWIIEPDKLCSHVNKVWLDFTGRTLEQELGNGWVEGVHADDLQRCMAVFISAFDAHLPFTTEYRLRRYDGEYRWILDNGVPRFANDGTFLGYIGSCIDITDRKIMEERLEQQHTLLNNVINSLSHPFYVVNTDDYSIELANQNSGEWLKGQTTCYQLSHKQNSPCDTKEHTCPIKEVKRTKQPLVVEHLHYNKNGEQRLVEVFAYPIFNEAGEVHQIIEYAIDITERKQAELKMASSLSLLYATLESSSDAILVVDLNNTWVLYNQKFIDLWHISDDIITNSDDSIALFYVLDQIEDADGFLHKVQELYHNPEANSFDLINFKNGKIVERYSIPQRVNNEVVGRVWSFRDITERARAEQALQRESEKNHALLRNASDGIHILDIDGNLIEFSDSFCHILGYSREEMIGMNVTQWDDCFSPDECIQVVKKQFEKPVRVLFETRHRCKDGHIIDVEVSGFPLMLNGKPALFNSSRDITERKRMEKGLKVSEARFRSIIDVSPVPMALNDKYGAISFLNPAFVRTFGYDVSDLPTLADWWSKAYPDPNYRQWVIDTWQTIMAQCEREHKSIPSQEFNIHCKNGEQKTVLISATTISQSFNDEYLVVLYDITEHKLAELEKQVSEERLGAFFELDLVGLTITSPEKGWLRINDCLCNMLEYSEDELRQMIWTELTHPDDLAADEQQFNKLLANEIDGYALEKRFISRTGKIIPTELVVRCVRKDNGAVDYVMAMVEDITERKQLEEQLRNNFLYTRNLIEVSLDPLVTISIDGKITDVNKATEKVTGFTREQLIGSDFSDYFTKPDQARKGYLLAFSEGYVTDYPLEIKHCDGSLTNVLYNAVVYKNKNGEVAGVFAAARDITELRRVESELKRSNADLEQFAYAVSHDMRQPLRMVTSYLSLIETALATQLDEETRQFLRFAIDGAKRMDAMILSLLDYSRVGRRTQALSIISSRTAVDEALAFLEPDIKANAGHIEVTGDWVELYASGDELTRLLQNLIGNALKYHEENKPPYVEVRASVTANTFKVAVRDSGIGIDPNQIDRLFKVFSRLQARTRFEGSGVGLALCRKIVEHHGGQIGVESTGEGQGSVFWFELPLAVKELE